MKKIGGELRTIFDVLLVIVAINFLIAFGYFLRVVEDKSRPIIKFDYVSFENENRLRKNDHRRNSSRDARYGRVAKRVPRDSTDSRDSMWILGERELLHKGQQ